MMHEPDAIQLSLLDGFSRNLAEREGFSCRGYAQADMKPTHRDNIHADRGLQAHSIFGGSFRSF